MKVVRLLVVGWLLNMKILSRSSFDAMLGILYPLFFATVAFFIFRAGMGERSLLGAALGAAVMAIWSTTSTAASDTLARLRWHGTLEVLVAAPVHFALVILPVTIAMATIGLYGMAATLLWGWLVFGIELEVTDPLAFLASVTVTVVSIGTLGFLLAVAFVRFRQAWALGNMLEYPVWLVCGFLVPLTLLPAWVRPISYALAPTWGIEAIRDSIAGISPWDEISWAVALAAAYTLTGVLVVEYVLARARARGTLGLA